MSPFVMALWPAAPAGGVVIESTATSGTPNQATSHPVTLPPDYQSGDLVVVMFRCTGSGLTAPSGWTATISIGTTSSLLLYRVMDGTEGSTIYVASASNDRSGHIAYRFSGVDTAAETFIVGTGMLNSVDAPNLSIPWAGDSLAVAWVSNRATDFDFTQPSPYTDKIQFVTREDQLLGHVIIASAHREVSAANEDPGAWTGLVTSSTPHAGVFAVKPA